MSAQILQIFYSSDKGPVEFKGINVSTQSPKGLIKITKEGQQNELDKELKQFQEDYKQSENQSRRFQTVNTNNFFDGLKRLGIEITGEEQEKTNFLKSIQIEQQINNFTIIYNDDCGAQINTIAFFRDTKFYYRVDCTRTWPGYEP